MTLSVNIPMMYNSGMFESSPYPVLQALQCLSFEDMFLLVVKMTG